MTMWSSGKGEFGIVANVMGRDRSARFGSKAWILYGAGGEGFDRFVWILRTRGGRFTAQWRPTKRFRDFRAAWIPEHLRTWDGFTTMCGSREEMERIAATLNEMVVGRDEAES